MALPVAGIVCIVLACWVVVVLALFGLYQFLKHRGSCDCECAPCGTEGGESCTCCKAVSDACNCCNPSLNGCLNSVCPKKKVSCVDIVLCQCCAEPGQDSCLVNIFPCCTRDCECCDGCCTCCADCDAVICCCLEIRLVSKDGKKENYSTSAKYTPNYSTTTIHKSNQNNSGKHVQNSAKSSVAAETVTAKTVSSVVKDVNKNVSSAKSSNVKSTQSTPRSSRSQTTARSVSQLELVESGSSIGQQRTGKPATKMKPPSGASKKTDKKSLPESKKPSSRSLPLSPISSSQTQAPRKINLKTGARKRTYSEPSAGELKEIPIKQQSVLLHSHLYENSVAIATGIVSSRSDLILALPQHYDAFSQTVSLDSSLVNLQSYSSVPMSPGTILDGAGTHRSIGAGSSISVHFDLQEEKPQLNVTSPRPLPGPPAR